MPLIFENCIATDGRRGRRKPPDRGKLDLATASCRPDRRAEMMGDKIMSDYAILCSAMNRMRIRWERSLEQRDGASEVLAALDWPLDGPAHAAADRIERRVHRRVTAYGRLADAATAAHEAMSLS